MKFWGCFVLIAFMLSAACSGDISGKKGEVILFERCTSSNSGCDIYSIKYDGSKEKNLTKDIDYDVNSPRASEDGEKIVFVSKNGYANELFLMDSDGSNKKEIADTSGALNPNWFPDNKKVVFEYNGGIYKIDITGNNKKLLVKEGTYPDVSPDGKTLIFTGKDSKGVQAIYKADIDGTDKKKIGKDQSTMGTFSPDGKKIAYRYAGGSSSTTDTSSRADSSTDTSVSNQVYVMDSDGSDPVKIDSSTVKPISSPYPPQWSAAGNSVVFEGTPSTGEYSTYSQICVATSSGGNFELVTEEKHYCRSPFPAVLVIGNDDNTADFEKYQNSLLEEINYARTKPSEYADDRLKSYYDSGTDNGSYNYMKSRSALGEITLNNMLCSAAVKYSKYLTDNNQFEHNANDTPQGRCEAEGYSKYSAENLAYGNDSVYNFNTDVDAASKKFVADMLIDSVNQDLYRRSNVMNKNNAVMGVGFSNNDSSNYKNVLVIDFGSE